MTKAEISMFSRFGDNRSIALQTDLNFDYNKSLGGVYDFTPLSRSDEDMGVYWASRLIQGHKKLNRQVIVEIGHHDKLSPFETAANYPDTTVLGIEIATISWERADVQPFVKDFNNSLVALFQFDAARLSDKGLQVDRVQSVAPDPWSEHKILEYAWPLVGVGGQIVMPIDAMFENVYYEDRPEQKVDNLAAKFRLTHPNFKVRVDRLAIDEIKRRYGFGDSKYLVRPEYPEIPVIVAERMF